MNTICLVQADGFLVGIKAADIVSRMTAGAVSPEGRARMADFGALLACKPGRAASSDAPCLELRGQDETFFLLVEEIGEEIEAAGPLAPLPSVCPALTARLCPQTAVCGAAAVPLLDPAQVIPVCAQLGKGIGLIAEEEPEPVEEAGAKNFSPLHGRNAEAESLPETIVEQDEAELFFAAAEAELAEPEPSASVEMRSLSHGETMSDASVGAKDFSPLHGANAEAEPAVVVFAQDEAASLFAEEEDAPLSGEPAASGSEEALPEPAPELEPALVAVAEEAPPPVAADEQPQPKKAADSIDEETFKEVMSWTVARFKQSRGGKDVQLGVEQLPPDLAARVRQKGLDNNVIQYLIDQIVLRCQESTQRRKPGEQHGG